MKFIKYYDNGVSNAMISNFSTHFGLDKKIIKLIVSRGYKTQEGIFEFLNPSYKHLHNPFKLKNMQKAVDKINEAIKTNQKILIFGDYDVDGVSATAIMIKLFEKLGVKANYYLPNRYVDGYGLTNQVLDKIKKLYNPNLIITVDCGITSHTEVEYAKTLGIDTIITDHHEIGEILPDTIVLNAKLKDQEYPFSQLCGTGLAFKIAQAMIGEEAYEFLPIAAIATVADIVELKDENRAIVKLGLDLMEKHLPIGLKTMIKGQKLNLSKITSTDIAFKIAPKLNASGRMGDAQDSLLLYLEKNPVKIKKLVDEILAHNTDRQALCNVAHNECKKQLENVNLSQQKAIILQSENWDQGILGIVCSRLLDEYNRPVFLFSIVDGVLKGSARSLPEVNVHLLLTDMQDILETFGGHTVAAGMSLKAENFEEFKNRVNVYIHEHINDKVFEPVSFYNEDLSIDEISESFCKQLSVLEPLGCENQPPRFKISCHNVVINPMRNYPNHANILLGKKLSLVAFNYLKDSYKLKYAKGKSFIFEFQDSRYKSPYLKGLLKQFSSIISLEGKTLSNIESFYLEQLAYNQVKDATFKQYQQEDIINFINRASLSVFGTCLVFSSQEALKEFVSKYDTENFYNFEVGEQLSSDGFNAILFNPIGVEWAKNFKTIVFIDAVLDKGYIGQINKISGAEVFVPKDKKFDNKIFNKIYAKRDNFGKIFNIFKKLQNKNFINYEDLYTEFYKHKINFQDFYGALLVFKELNLLEIEKDEFISIKVRTNKKVDLNSSAAFNFFNLMKSTK